jgi:hypothetical protein
MKLRTLAFFFMLCSLCVVSCVSASKTNIVELENKGTVMNIPAPSPASRMTNAAVAANRYANMTDTGRFREKRFKEIRHEQRN